MPTPPAYAYTRSPPKSAAWYSETVPPSPARADAASTPLRQRLTAGTSAAISSAATTRKMCALTPLLVLHHRGARTRHALHRPVRRRPRLHGEHRGAGPHEQQHRGGGAGERGPARQGHTAREHSREQQGDHEMHDLGMQGRERHESSAPMAGGVN